MCDFFCLFCILSWVYSWIRFWMKFKSRWVGVMWHWVEVFNDRNALKRPKIFGFGYSKIIFKFPLNFFFQSQILIFLSSFIWIFHLHVKFDNFILQFNYFYYLTLSLQIFHEIWLMKLEQKIQLPLREKPQINWPDFHFCLNFKSVFNDEKSEIRT